MNNFEFVHLHVHSEHSVLDGLGGPKHYAERAAELGFRAVAVTDHGNIDAHLKWQMACRKAGIKPVLGCELYLTSDMKSHKKEDPHGHLVVLVKSVSGWEALARMLSVANLEGFYYRPRIDGRVLLEHVNDGLVVLTGCNNSFLLMPEGRSLLVELGQLGVDCCLEVMPHQSESQAVVNRLCLELAEKYGLLLVATNDCHYVRAEHAKAQEVLLAIQRQAKWKDKDRWRFEIEGLHLRTADEMIEAFREQGVLTRQQYYGAVANTVEVAEWCWGFEMPKREMDLPLTKYERERPTIPAINLLDWLCRAKMGEMKSAGRWPDEYEVRYSTEKELIGRKGFARYFLMVYEIVEWCRKQGIMVGPGRGSIGGSLIAYLLNITQVDSLQYNLLFERFISEDRIDWPDIDLDFEDLKCDQVRAHLEEEYGKYNVAGISAFGSLKGRGVVRDVGRVFELPVSEIDAFAKAIRAGTNDENIVMTAVSETKEGQQFVRKYPEEVRLMEVLEGQIRSAGQHPAGLVISAKDLRRGENGVLCRRSDVLVSNWDMDDTEYNGLIKVDVLKLGTLTVLNEIRRLMRLNGKSVAYCHPESDCFFVGKAGEIGDRLTEVIEEMGEFDYPMLPLNDHRVFKMLSAGNTSGVFQFSGYACTNLCVKMGVESFEDMAAVTALARPGPADSGMTDLYVRRKKGERWRPIHPVYEAITKETYGVMVYQEQMMRAMTDLAGFSNADADRIRKVIGKKRKAEEFEPYREAFMNGCWKKTTLTVAQAAEFWEGLLGWAHYGFNKSHAVEYAMIGYWTCWAKLYHPVEFYCAQLTYGEDSQKGDLIEEIELAGMKVVTPKVGESDARRWVAREDRLYMPFVEIKGIGEAQADKCIGVRGLGGGGKKASPPRRGFFDLKEESQVQVVPKGKLEKLLFEIRAFDPDPASRPANPLDYFQFKIGDAVDTRPRIVILPKRMMVDEQTKYCKFCGLREQASQVVLPSLGVYNVMVLGEAPGKDEDAEGRGYVGDASEVLWGELASYGVSRRMLHVGNVCKCWPSWARTPSKEEIKECFERWALPEILSMDCRLILATGNAPLFALTGKDSGIKALSGQVEWVEKAKAWVVWCIHPSAVLRKRSENYGPFKDGVRAFAEAFKKGVE